MTAPTAYVTAADAKVRVESLSDFSDELVEGAVAEFESIFERYRGYSCIPRTVEAEEVTNRPLGWLVLDWPLVDTGEDVTITCDGTALDLTEAIILGQLGEIRNIPWPGGIVYSATVSYTHGLAAVPAMVARGCIEYVNRTLRSEDTGIGRDVLSQGFDGGQTRYITPDWNAGRPTGWLEVDRILNSQPDRRRPAFAPG